MSANYWKMTVQLNRDPEKDADLISYLERQANKNDAVRRALRAQMEEEASRKRAIEVHESGD